jgi:hypothetical protein
MVKADNPIAELEKKLEEEQAGKRTPLTTNNIMSPHGRFWPDGFRTFFS